MTNIIEIPTADDSKVAVPNIEFNSINVLTTEILAILFGCEAIRIQQSFVRNKQRFTLNKHYFELTGSELKVFKNQYFNSTEYQNDSLSIVGKNAKILILWTERGCTLLSKIINTPQAWDMQETLVDFYFNAKQKEAKSQQQESKTSYNPFQHNSPVVLPIHNALAVADFVTRSLRMSETSVVNMASKICINYDVNPNFLPEYIEQNPVSCLSKLLEDFNLTHLGTAHKLNLILEEHGILEKITRKSTKSEGKLKSFWSLTSKGLEWGKNEVYPPNPRETQPLYFREKFMSLLTQLQIM